MTIAQKKKKIHTLLDSDKNFLELVDSLADEFKEKNTVSLSDSQWKEIERREKEDPRLSEEEFSSKVRTAMKKLT